MFSPDLPFLYYSAPTGLVVFYDNPLIRAAWQRLGYPPSIGRGTSKELVRLNQSRNAPWNYEMDWGWKFISRRLPTRSCGALPCLVWTISQGGMPTIARKQAERYDSDSTDT